MMTEMTETTETMTDGNIKNAVRSANSHYVLRFWNREGVLNPNVPLARSGSVTTCSKSDNLKASLREGGGPR